ncbi:MAG: TNT domain-containing protein, partial [Oscillospiraceae bacterium]
SVLRLFQWFRTVPCPYDKIGQATTLLQVQQPLQALGGQVAPWFGQIGGGTQYLLNSPVNQLITDGILKIMGD